MFLVIAILLVMAVLALAGPLLEDLLGWIGGVSRRHRPSPRSNRTEERHRTAVEKD
jgi:hypothetical protein